MIAEADLGAKEVEGRCAVHQVESPKTQTRKSVNPGSEF